MGGQLRVGGIPVLPGERTRAWVFLPLGTPHDVTPVTAGSRLVLKAAVHWTRVDGGLARPFPEKPKERQEYYIYDGRMVEADTHIVCVTGIRLPQEGTRDMN